MAKDVRSSPGGCGAGAWATVFALGSDPESQLLDGLRAGLLAPDSGRRDMDRLLQLTLKPW